LLKHYGGWSLTESYNLPIKLREWFVKRTQEEIKKQFESKKE